MEFCAKKSGHFDEVSFPFLRPPIRWNDDAHSEQGNKLYNETKPTRETMASEHGEPYDGMMCLCTMEDITLEDGNYGEW